MDFPTKGILILRVAAERVLRNLCAGRMVFLDRPEPLRTGMTDVPDRQGYGLNNHGQPEIAQIVYGAARLNGTRGATRLTASKCHFISPGTLHGETYWRVGDPYVLLWIVIYPGSTSFFLSEYNGKHFGVRAERSLVETPAWRPIWNAVTGRGLRTDLLNRAKVQQYLLEVCGQIAEHPDRQLDGTLAYHQKLADQIRGYIDLHYHEPITVDDLARIARCSANYLNTVFRRQVGMPIHRYILQQRLQEAKRLRQNSDCTVKEIAYRLGFRDPLYFSRLFQKAFGVPASRFP